MAEFTRELFFKTLEEWGRYVGSFGMLDPEEQAAFLRDQGYASIRDLMAHVAAWWEEGRTVIDATIKRGEKPGRKYDFAEFNAAAVKRFGALPEAEFLRWYEAERQRVIDVLSHVTDTQFQNRRVQNWLNAILLEHLKEHGVDAPRFLIVDMLQREWGDYTSGFHALDTGQQTAFVRKQGYESFRDLLGHIIAWWEHGIAVIEGAAQDYSGDVEDIDAFNAAAVERFRSLEEGQVLARYEDTRLTLGHLVDMLPDEVLSKPNVQSWIRADVIHHYYEHAL